MVSKLRPIVLAGGVGKRLWPLSTEKNPKQFIPIFKEFSLFDLTLQRLNKASLFKQPIIVTSEKYLNKVNESLQRTGIEVEKIILEPEPKNTCPAITMPVILSLLKNSQEDFFVCPSDHYVSKNKNFYESCLLARKNLNESGLMLMGIQPEHPSTEYGYILTEENQNSIKKVKRFIEKPDLKDAKNLIKKNNVYWNSGMFIFNGSWFLETLKSLEPLAYKNIFKAIESGKNKSKYFYPEKRSFSKISSISFDKAFAEKESNILMATLDAGWSDLGSWLSLSALQKLPSSAMTLYSEGLYERCEKPWGFYEILMETNLSKVKLISVFPNQKLSLQKHKYRAETWYVISGTAKVTKGNERFTMQAGDSVIIDKNQIHRLENIAEEPLEVIEIQTGSYFGEDDIVRLEDTYGRADIY